ncbi:MAG: hypothetical protein ACR2NR_23725 [Solirubrobacteraceae bacterium]
MPGIEPGTPSVPVPASRQESDVLTVGELGLARHAEHAYALTGHSAHQSDRGLRT